MFTLTATVRNASAADSPATTLRVYRSDDATITTSDMAEGSNMDIAALDAGASSPQTVVNLTAPAAGTYYYGACVASVTDEADTDNNCSVGVMLTVTDSP